MFEQLAIAFVGAPVLGNVAMHGIHVPRPHPGRDAAFPRHPAVALGGGEKLQPENPFLHHLDADRCCAVHAGYIEHPGRVELLLVQSPAEGARRAQVVRLRQRPRGGQGGGELLPAGASSCQLAWSK